MDKLIDFEVLLAYVQKLVSWFNVNVLNLATLIQGGIVLGLLVLSWGLGIVTQRLVLRRWPSIEQGAGVWLRLKLTLLKVIPPVFSFLLIGFTLGIAKALDLSHGLFVLGENLLGAWIVIRLASFLFLSRFFGRLFALVAWSAAALNTLGFLDDIVDFLDSASFSVGGSDITTLSFLKALVLMFVLYRGGMALAEAIEVQLSKVSELTPSARVLFGKLMRIVTLVAIVIIALSSVGINLTALAVFSGAVGVGVGFGLQKVAANLISGFILLMDKSIKPGDVVEVGTVYGYITSLRARFVSVLTRDGKEILIPNEDLITNQVVNWSFSDTNVRLKVPVGISYDADPRVAMELMTDAATGHDRVQAFPKPVCRLMGFGDSSVDLELRVWIRDPQNGIVNVKSDLLLAIWDRFQENGIEIPYPQRDLHIRSGMVLPSEK